MLKFLAAAALIALLGSSCAQQSAAPPDASASAATASPAQPVALQVIDVAKKGMTAAHQAHGLAADLLRVAAESGYLHGDNAATAATLLRQSAAYLKTGDTAISLGDVTGAQDAIDKSSNLLDQIHALLGK